VIQRLPVGGNSMGIDVWAVAAEAVNAEPASARSAIHRLAGGRIITRIIDQWPDWRQGAASGDWRLPGPPPR
jgi:hypothetical protein